jgi:hypothetical protein
MTDGGVLTSEPQNAVHQAYNMIRLETMRRQIQRMLSDKLGSLKRLPPRYALGDRPQTSARLPDPRHRQTALACRWVPTG